MSAKIFSIEARDGSGTRLALIYMHADRSGIQRCLTSAPMLHEQLKELAVLPLQRLHLVGDICWNARPLAAVDFRLLYPLIQRVRVTADLRGYRHDRLPVGTVLALIVQHQPNCTLADLRRILICCLAHCGFILLRS